jgi:hypothetical protein
MTQASMSLMERAEQSFRRHAELARSERAPLYENLAIGIADDPVLLEIATHVRPTQSMPYLLYDAVQYLLLSGVEHELAGYYASLTPTPDDPRTAFPVFRAFVMDHKDEIVKLVETHVNQTNEIGRIAAILPVLGEVQRRGGGQPIAIVEVGPSGGLLLCFDRYYIDYGRARWGDPAAQVLIRCELEDGRPPPLEPGVPTVAYRIGLDIEPLDLTDDHEARWMLSSMWPDHRDLALRQRDAIEELRKDPPKLVQGDCLEIQPLLDEVPPELTLCVLQSFVFSHVPEQDRQTFMQLLERESKRRPVYYVSMGGDNMSAGNRRARVDLTWWVNGEHGTQKLVDSHSRGRSMRWLG